MKKTELEKLKKELMKPGLTEDLHHSLAELPSEDAKIIVESMSDTEIYLKVNNRQFQEDYIADYLEYLWGISETAYWKHVKSTLNLKHGILWGDHMSHFEKMCRYQIPDDVLKAVFDFAIAVEVEDYYKQDFEAIGCVIKAQVDDFGRLNEIRKYISLLENDKQEKANERIKLMLKSRCHYTFY